MDLSKEQRAALENIRSMDWGCIAWKPDVDDPHNNGEYLEISAHDLNSLKVAALLAVELAKEQTP